jgi:hypothetical protein
VQSLLLNKVSGRSTSTSVNIQHFALRDGEHAMSLHFEVSGFAVETVNPAGSRLDIEAAGAGDRNGDLLILRGSINVGVGTTEVVPDDGPATGGDIIDS